MMQLEGSCRCGAVRFSVGSHTPHPFMRCYCAICRKTAGSGGFGINIMAVAASLRIAAGKSSLTVWQAQLPREGDAGPLETSPARRHFCQSCGSALWVSDPRWSENVYPFASAIDTALPTPPERVHIMLEYKAPWVVVPKGTKDRHFRQYPEESIADWHKTRGLWVT